MTPRSKWMQEARALRVGDIVCLRFDSKHSSPLFKLARVVETEPGRDGVVRTVQVKMAGTRKIITTGFRG